VYVFVFVCQCVWVIVFLCVSVCVCVYVLHANTTLETLINYQQLSKCQKYNVIQTTVSMSACILREGNKGFVL
jgi:hypothetical protein